MQHYIQKKWLFTVMKIDTMQMKRNKDGTFAGEVTPTRFKFASDKIVYPLKITQISVREKTEALFYVQAPFKVDLEGDMSYQFTWVPMLDAASGCTPGGLPGKGGDWLAAYKAQIPALLARAEKLDFRFIAGQRPTPNKQGHIPTTMEWARKLSKDDIGIVTGKAPYSEKVPNVDEGFTQADLKDPQRAEAIYKVIRSRLAKCQKERPFGYLVREAPAERCQGFATARRPSRGGAVHHQVPQDFRARRDERRFGDRAGAVQRGGGYLGVRGIAAGVAAVSEGRGARGEGRGARGEGRGARGEGSLVPKLRLGTHVLKLCFESDGKQSFRTCVPKRSLGTRKYSTEENA